MSMSFCESEVVDRAAASRGMGRAVEVPPEYVEYALAVQKLVPAEFLLWCRTVVLSRRAGSYEFVDVVLLLLAFFTSSMPEVPLATFVDESAPYGPELAGAGGRERWMSQASASRALSAVSPEAAEVAARMLLELTSTLFRDAPLATTAGYRDGRGDTWTVLHWDTTVTALRQRALPEGDDLPEAVRLTSDFAAPGYPGRKRGQVQISRSVLQDATTAGWVHVGLQPGNGHLEEQLGAAAVAASRYLRGDPARIARAVVIADGVGGGVVQAVQLDAQRVPFLTRWAQYDFLETPECSKVLATGPWCPVPDSKSGPRREAMELGTVELQDTVTCRAIVTRFRAKPGRQRGAGRSIGSWRYELFITTLPADRWAAEDVVTLYYGRNAIENRFAAENREFKLDRVFSYSTPGQLLSYAVAMAIWNLRIAGGFAATPEEGPPRPLRVRPQHPAPPTQPDAPGQPLEPERATTKLEQSPEVVAQKSELPSASDPRHPWCDTHPTWRLDPDSDGLRCPAGEVIPLSGLRQPQTSTALWAARYRAPTGVCDTCTLRQTCSPGARSEHSRREVSIPVPSPEPIRERLDARTRLNATPPQLSAQRRVALLKEPSPEPPHLPEATILLPAVLRKMTVALYSQARVEILAPPPPKREERREDLAEDDPDRQRRRLTIPERVALNERQDPDAVDIVIHAPPKFLQWVQALKDMKMKRRAGAA